MTIKDFIVGQTAYMIERDNRRRRSDYTAVTITKIGRKYVTVKSGSWDLRFEPPYSNKGYLREVVSYGIPRILFPTEQAVKDYVERNEITLWLSENLNWAEYSKYTLEQLRSVKAILEGVETESR